jgi:hypothetical protein
MKAFDVSSMPEKLQAIVRDLPYVQDSINNDGGAEFVVNTAPDPEWGNMHVPVAQWLIKNGANKLERVYLKNITDALS